MVNFHTTLGNSEHIQKHAKGIVLKKYTNKKILLVASLTITELFLVCKFTQKLRRLIKFFEFLSHSWAILKGIPVQAKYIGEWSTKNFLQQ